MTTATQPDAMPLHVRVARNVRAELARIGVTQAQAAEACRMQQQGMSQRLRGKIPFTLNELDILAALANMDAADFITGNPGPGDGPNFAAAAACPRQDSNLRPSA